MSDDIIIIVPNHIHTVYIPYDPPLDFPYCPWGEIPRAEITYHPLIDSFLPRTLPNGRGILVIHHNNLCLN